jgi:phenylacetate-coenzyme A ligase PaaK-like adenylate-forming protein
LIESIEGRTEDILYFADRAGQPDVIAIHPNLFHGVLETIPATGWQVVQDESGLSVLLTGIRNESIREPLVAQLDRALAQHGAVPGAIDVALVDALPRGATGKAPLIVRKPASQPLAAAPTSRV